MWESVFLQKYKRDPFENLELKRNIECTSQGNDLSCIEHEFLSVCIFYLDSLFYQICGYNLFSVKLLSLCQACWDNLCILCFMQSWKRPSLDKGRKVSGECYCCFSQWRTSLGWWTANRSRRVYFLEEWKQCDISCTTVCNSPQQCKLSSSGT